MSKKLMAWVLAFVMVLGMLPAVALAEGADAVEIASADELVAFAAEVNGGNTYEGETVTLTGDIDLSEVAWTPIGNGTRSGSSYEGNAFKGTFDGGENTITGLTDSLFGIVAGGTVSNIDLEADINNASADSTGAAVAVLVGGTVENVNVTGSVTGYKGVGGVVGRMLADGEVSDCTNAADVTQTGTADSAGGIVGKAYYTASGKTMNIIACSNSGEISSPYCAGGIVGFSAASVFGCENTGAAVGGVEAGGIVGEQTNYGTVQGNTNKGDVSSTGGGTAYGGIIGWIRYQNSAESYPVNGMIVVSENVNYGAVSASGCSLGAGGIVGTVYNQADITDNESYASSVAGGTFAAGIAGALQPAGNNLVIEGKTISVTGNVMRTQTSAITASGDQHLTNPIAYNNDSSFVVEDNEYGVAEINGELFGSLQDAFAAVQEGETIQLLEGTVVLGTVKMPATLKNVTLKGADDHASVLKDGVIRAADGNSLCYEGLTFDGVVFENAYIGITGWRSGDESYKDLTVTNCVFKDVENTTNEGAVHLNLEKNAAVNGFTFTNNVIDGLLGGQKSGVYGEFTGKFTYTGNTVNNVTFRPMVAQFADQDGIEDIAVVEGNTFSGSAAGRVQLLGSHENYVPKGTDKLSVSITNNIFTDITNAQQICCWGLATNGGTFDISKNYYDIDLEANPSRIYFNGAAANLSDLVEKGVYPIYTELNEDGTIDTESAYTPDGVASVDNVDYYDLQKAVNAADGKTVVVLADIELGETLRVEAGKTVTLDLNGKTVSMVWEEDITANHAMILNYGDLTIQDSSEDESGELFYQYTGADTNFGKATDTISSQPGSVLTLKSGSVVNKTTANGIAYAVDGMTNGGIGEVTLNFEGGYVSSEKIAVRIFANSTTKTGYLNISGGEFHGRVQIHSSNANANLAEIAISGGEFHANSYKPHALYLDGSGNFAAVKASVTGGEFYGEVSSQVENFITGGQFEDDVIDYVPLPGYTDYNDGMYGVVFDAVAAIGYEEYKFLQDAIDDAENGDTIKLLGDIVLGSPVTVPAGLEITLDLNGKTVSYVTTEDKGESMITNKGDLTITDSGKGGKLSYAYAGTPDSNYTYGNYTIENKGVLTVEAGTVENTSAAISHAFYAINTGAGADLYVEGGQVLNLNGHAIRMTSFGPGATNVTVSGGYVEGTRAIQFQLPGSASATTAPEMNLLIEGGELKSNEETYNLAVYVYSHGQSAANVTVTVTGGTLNGNVALNGAATNTMAANAATVSGGTINGVYGIFSYADDEVAIPVIAITGGTFATNYSQFYCAEDDYLFLENADGTYGVEMNVDATIDGVEYSSLAKAIAAAEEGDTIVLAKDIVAADTIEVGADKVITLDLNGCTLSMVRTEQITDSDTLIRNKGDLTITDSSEDESGKISYKFDGTVDRQWAYAVTTISNQLGTLTVEGGTIESLSLSTNSEGASTYVYKFTIDSLTNGGGGDATLNISGGKITAAKGGPVRGFANSTTCTNTINITGGEFVGQVWMQDPSAGANKGVLNITGGEITSFIEGVDAVYFYGLGDSSGFEVNIGGDVVVNGSTYLTVVDATKPFTADISGGTFNGEVWTSTWDSNDVETAVPTITGGTFMYDPTDYLAEGCFSVENADGTYGVSGVVEVGGETYATLKEAFDAAEAGDTVKLLADVTITEQAEIRTPITLDLNEKTLTATCEKALRVHADATIENGTITNTANKGRCVDIREAVEVTLDGVTLNTTGTGNTQPVTVGGTEDGTVLNVTNSEISAGEAGYGIIVYVASEITVENSSAVAGYGALYLKPDINANGGKCEATIKNSTLTGFRYEQEVFGLVVFEANDAVIEVIDSELDSKGNPVFLFSENAAPSGNAVSISGDSTVTGPIYQQDAGENNTVTIYGGTYSVNPAKYLAAGLKSVRNANGTFSVTARDYTMTFLSDNGDILSKTKVNYQAAVTAPETAREGYNFIGWFDAEGTKVDVTAFTMPETDVTLTGKWAAVPTVTDPAAVELTEGETAVFTVEATGEDVTYQWQYKRAGSTKWYNSPAEGNKTASLTVPGTLDRNGNSYRCVVTDVYGYTAISEGAVLTVNEALPELAIVTEPEDVDADLGDEVELFVEVNREDVTYQWQYKAASGSKWVNSPAEGNDSDTLVLAAIPYRDGNSYRCVITDSEGGEITSEEVVLGVALACQPEDVEIEAGETAEFTVDADLDGMTYQWQYKRAGSTKWYNSPAEGSKTDTLTVPGTLERDGNQYRCRITDYQGGVIYSDAATLTVIEPIPELAIVTEPEDVETEVGIRGVFTVEVEGGEGEYAYQWYYRTSKVGSWKKATATGNTTDTLRVPGTLSRNGYQYYCLIVDEAGNEVESEIVTLTVFEPIPELAIVTEPEDVETTAGVRGVFTVEVEGGEGEYAYQWYYRTSETGSWKKATATGNTTDTLRVPGTLSRNGYQYYCLIVDEAGNEVESEVVTLTVK